MSMALEEAKKALEHDDIPIGCIIVLRDEVVASNHNRVEQCMDSTAHAEILAIRDAQKQIGHKHLLDCTMYTTLEPCSMCAGAIVLSRISELYISASDPKSGACGSIFNIANNNLLNHRCKIDYGLLERKSSVLIRDFFKELRKKNGRRN